MSLEETINEELKKAIKSGDKIRMETLRSIRAAIVEFKKSGIGRDLNRDEELKILQSGIKKRRDAIELYQRGGREDLAKQEQKEIEIIMEFMPEQYDEGKVREILTKIISEIGATSLKDLGKVMATAMQSLKGKADGSLVQKIAREILSQMG